MFLCRCATCPGDSLSPEGSGGFVPEGATARFQTGSAVQVPHMDRNCHHTVASGHGSEETEEEKTGEISYQKSSGKRVGDLPFILSGQKIDFLFLLRKISPTRAAASPWTVQVMKGAAERERERLAKQVSLSFFLSVHVCLPVCLCVFFLSLHM